MRKLSRILYDYSQRNIYENEFFYKLILEHIAAELKQKRKRDQGMFLIEPPGQVYKISKWKDNIHFKRKECVKKAAEIKQEW